MKCLRSSVLAMIEALLLLSTASAQVNTSFLATPADRENPKSWTRFTSPTDKFEVLMPAAPLLKQEALRIAGREILLNYYGARRGQSDFAVVTLTGLSDHNWYLAHMLMLDWYRRSNEPIDTPQAVRSASSFRAIFQKGISLEGYAGRQFSLEGDERVGEWRMYEVNKKFYAVAGSSISRSAYSLRPFFDSFSLSDSNSAAPNVTKKVANPAARWLIILQTFSRNERAKANLRMNLLQSQGFAAQVVSTDSYSNLRPGLLVLAMGPFSKRAAEQRLPELRSVAPNSYMKAAW